MKSDIRHQTGGGDLWADDQSVVEFRDRVVEHEQPEQGVVAGAKLVALETRVPGRRAAAPVRDVGPEALVGHVVLVPEDLHARCLEEGRVIAASQSATNSAKHLVHGVQVLHDAEVLPDGVDLGEYLDGPVLVQHFNQHLLRFGQDMGTRHVRAAVFAPVLRGRVTEDHNRSIGQGEGLADELLVDLLAALAVVALLPVNHVDMVTSEGAST